MKPNHTRSAVGASNVYDTMYKTLTTGKPVAVPTASNVKQALEALRKRLREEEQAMLALGFTVKTRKIRSKKQEESTVIWFEESQPIAFTIVEKDDETGT